MGVIAGLIKELSEGRCAEIDTEPLIGLSGKELIKKIRETYRVTITEDMIRLTRMDKMRVPGVLKKDPKLVDFLKFLKTKNIPYIVATSSSIAPVEIALDSLNLGEYFEKNIYSIDEFPDFLSKSELYSELKNRYVNDEIIVIEDSVNGITAANTGGIKNIIAYKNQSDVVKDKIIFSANNFGEIFCFVKGYGMSNSTGK
jgi:beta-phosphoglucomutase-like phosphatase (HAD superfamily)